VSFLKSSGAALVFVAYASQLFLMASALGVGFLILSRSRSATAERGAPQSEEQAG